MKKNKSFIEPAEGEVVVIKGNDRNKGKWKIGVIEQLYPEPLRVRRGKNKLERAVQHLYPLELQCGISKNSKQKNEVDRSNEHNNELDFDKRNGNASNMLNVKAKVYKPERSTAAIAKLRIEDICENENIEPLIE